MITHDWICPQMWKGQTVFVIGGGPSVNTTSLDLIQHRPVIGVNSAFRLGSWVDVCFFGDGRWLNHERKALLDYKGLLVGLHPFHDKYKITRHDGLDIRLMKGCVKKMGFAGNPGELCWNRSSGGAAIDLAKHTGAKTIVLIGYDMKKVNGYHNWHNHYDVWYKDVRGRNPHRAHIRGITSLYQQARRSKINIINATPGSAITSFPIMTLEDFLNANKNKKPAFEHSKARTKARLSNRRARKNKALTAGHGMEM